jgi:periplasmic divalent cation tolerance protein
MAQDGLQVIFVTAPDAHVGRKLARTILGRRLAACVNIISGLESHYWWQGKLDQSAEVLLLIKTTKAKLKPLQKLVLEKHPYDTPEFVVFPANMVSRKYMDWVRDSVKDA